MLVSWLAECTWAATTVSSLNWKRLLILSWSWDLKLQTLAVENLIRIEARRGAIESDFLAREGLIISSSHLFGPLRSLIQVRNYVFSGSTNSCRIRGKTSCSSRSWRFIWKTLDSLVLICFENPNIGILHVNIFEPFSCWLEEMSLSSSWRSLLLVICYKTWSRCWA